MDMNNWSILVGADEIVVRQYRDGKITRKQAVGLLTKLGYTKEFINEVLL
jgi:hypothetical protein